MPATRCSSPASTPAAPPSKGETIHLRIRRDEEHVFYPETGERVGAATAQHGTL